LQLLPSPSAVTTGAAALINSPKYPVLTPGQRQVDDSLQAVFQRTKSVKQHLREYPNETLWCNRESGNWLHAAALWDESELVRVQLSQLPPDTIQELLQARDREGNTPVQVASMCGNETVAQILRQYSNVYESDYEYDLYCWEPFTTARPAMEKDRMEQQQKLQDNDDDILDCELHDRCTGYFDTRGELVLEAADDNNNNNNNGNPFAAVPDDDVDSNDEDWEGNDYPDEEDDGWSSSSTVSQDFRQRRMNNHGGDEIDEYDASFGIYGQNEPEYDEEC